MGLFPTQKIAVVPTLTLDVAVEFGVESANRNNKRISIAI